MTARYFFALTALNNMQGMLLVHLQFKKVSLALSSVTISQTF